MDLVRILNVITEDEDVTRLAIQEWFLTRQPQARAKQMYTVLLKNPSGGTLKLPKYVSDEREAIDAAEQWANGHARFGELGPWKGTVDSVEA